MLRSQIDSRRVLPLFNVKGFESVQTKNVEELITLAKMDWGVTKEQSYTKDGKPLDSWHLKRSDTGDILCDAVGKDWTPVQNVDKFKWFQPYMDSDLFTVVGAGGIHGGRETSILARVNLPEKEVVKGDVIGFYVYLSDTYGNRALRGSAMIVRLMCANGAVRQDVSGAFRVRHSSGVKANLDKVQGTFKLLTEQFQRVSEAYSFMASRPIAHAEELKSYIENSFDMDRKDNGNLSTRSLNMVNEIANKVETEVGITNRILQATENDFNVNAGRNYWQAYNAITEYLNHERGHKPETRLEALLYGNSAKVEQRAFALATESPLPLITADA